MVRTRYGTMVAMTPPPSSGEREMQTVTSDGTPTTPIVDGVVLHTPVTHVDHRGALFEIFTPDTEGWPAIYAYQTSVFPGQLKGWARHERKIDRYTLSSGELLLLLYDDREGSSTRGVFQRVMLSARSVRQVRIPVGVWHLIANLGNVEAQLLNHPTEAYVHDQPDRILLPWDSPEIPVDVRSYLRKF